MEAMSKQHDLELSGIREQIEEETQSKLKQLADELNKKQQVS